MKHRHTAFALVTLLSLAGTVACGGADPATGPDFSRALNAPVALTGSSTLSDPSDAAPDASGTNAYYLASSGARGPGVFRVAMSGGASTEVFVGAPLVAPRGIAVSSDASRVVVADSRAAMGGGVYVIPTTGGAPSLLDGTAGTAPQGVEVARVNGADMVFFTGTTLDTRRPAVFQVPLAGGAATVLAQGAPLVSPSALAIASNGTVFVSDRGASGTGSVYRLSNGTASAVINNVRMGNPAGLALTPDDKILAVSSVSASGSAQVFFVELATGITGTFDQVIRANAGSGGLHRAHGGSSNLLAWCGVTVGNTGTVYRIEFR